MNSSEYTGVLSVARASYYFFCGLGFSSVRLLSLVIIFLHWWKTWACKAWQAVSDILKIRRAALFLEECLALSETNLSQAPFMSLFWQFLTLFASLLALTNISLSEFTFWISRENPECSRLFSKWFMEREMLLHPRAVLSTASCSILRIVMRGISGSSVLMTISRVKLPFLLGVRAGLLPERSVLLPVRSVEGRESVMGFRLLFYAI